MNIVVVRLGEDSADDPGGSGTFFFVFPVNEDAVSVLGPDLVIIHSKDLTEISQHAILDAARKKRVP
jgi:hypothetical protein